MAENDIILRPARNIARQRRQLKITQKEMARLLWLATETVCRLEKGRHDFPCAASSSLPIAVGSSICSADFRPALHVLPGILTAAAPRALLRPGTASPPPDRSRPCRCGAFPTAPATPAGRKRHAGGRRGPSRPPAARFLTTAPRPVPVFPAVLYCRSRARMLHFRARSPARPGRSRAGGGCRQAVCGAAPSRPSRQEHVHGSV